MTSDHSLSPIKLKRKQPYARHRRIHSSIGVNDNRSSFESPEKISYANYELDFPKPKIFYKPLINIKGQSSRRSLTRNRSINQSRVLAPPSGALSISPDKPRSIASSSVLKRFQKRLVVRQRVKKCLKSKISMSKHSLFKNKAIKESMVGSRRSSEGDNKSGEKEDKPSLAALLLGGLIRQKASIRSYSSRYLKN